MTITYPAGMTKRARFIEGAVRFYLGHLRTARMILSMSDDEIREFRKSWIDPEWNSDPEWARIQCRERVSAGFRMDQVRGYAADIMSEH
jgi:hypothetical protein